MDEQQPKRRPGRPPATMPVVKTGGRPRYAPAAEQKATAERLLAVGESHEDIAHLLGISVRSFQSRFAPQISDARLRFRAEFLAVVFEKARAGNAGLLKLALDLTALPEPEAAPYQIPEAKPEPVAKPEKLGKKAQKALDAVNPDTGTPMGELMAARARGQRVQ